MDIRIKYFLASIIAGMLFLSACYDDKGNYDYQQLNEISISNIEQSYEKIALADSLIVQPEVTATIAADYDYMWYVINPDQSYDTLSFTRNLAVPVELSPESYTLVFRLTDRHTGIATYFKSDLKVVTEYSNGWFVLREINGMTDMDLFTPGGKKLTDIMLKVNGAALKGSPVQIGYANKFTADATSGKLKAVKSLIPMSDQDIQILRANDLVRLRGFEDMFYLAPGKCAPQKFMETSQAILFMNDNQLYSLINMMANVGKVTQPYIQDYHFSPVMTQDAFYCTVYEETTGQILQESFGNLMTKKKDIYAKLLHAFSLRSWDLYFLFQGREDPNLLFMYTPTGLDTLPSGLDIAHGKHFANNQEFSYIYFADGDQLKVLDVAGKSEKSIYNFQGEEITFIAHVKPSTQDINHLMVATYRDGNYKLYKFEMQAGIPRSDVEPEIMTGKGKVGYVFYMSDKYNGANYKPNFY